VLFRSPQNPKTPKPQNPIERNLGKGKAVRSDKSNSEEDRLVLVVGIEIVIEGHFFSLTSCLRAIYLENIK